MLDNACTRYVGYDLRRTSINPDIVVVATRAIVGRDALGENA